MTDYTITTDFGAKDSLPSGNAAKVIKGSEFTTEFTNILTAVNSKADTAGDTFTGAVTFDAAVTLNADVTFDTNTLFVDVSENKVGIGNVAPATALDVTGTVTASGIALSDNEKATFGAGSDLEIYHSGSNSFVKDVGQGNLLLDTNGSLAGFTSDGVSKYMALFNKDASVDLYYDNSKKLATTSTGIDVTGSISFGDEHTIGNDGFDNLTITSSSSENIVLKPSNATYIEHAGFTKLVTTSTGIDVNGAINGDSFNISDGTETTSIPATADRISFSGASFNYIQSSTNLQVEPQGDLVLFGTGSEIMRLKSGNVGIGTSNPAANLHVDSSSYTAATFERDAGASSGVSVDLINSDGNKFNLASEGTEDFNIGYTPSGGSKTNLLTLNSSGNVGIGTASPAKKLTVYESTASTASSLFHNNQGTVELRLAPSAYPNDIGSTARWSAIQAINGGSGNPTSLAFLTNSVSADPTERMRIDSSGNLLVGTTSTAISGSGSRFFSGGNAAITSAGTPFEINRLSADGNIIAFKKDGTTVGSIGTVAGGLTIGKGDTGFFFDPDFNNIRPFDLTAGGSLDATIDLGRSSTRFKDIYRSGSTYSTSDRNKKQDIRDLTDAEARVAVVAKGSLKAFRYIDTVEAEGNDANIHFGIIAQDLKAAFEAEGLNADSYQVLKTSTYTDDDGVEQTTYSVCYENLLAFIISAI